MFLKLNENVKSNISTAPKESHKKPGYFKSLSYNYFLLFLTIVIITLKNGKTNSEESEDSW